MKTMVRRILNIRFLFAVILAASIFPFSARCEDNNIKPASEMVIARDVPQHSAFRVGDRGSATTIATAREDLVLAGVGMLSNKPILLSDIAMSGVSSEEPGSSPLRNFAGDRSQIGNIGASLSRASPLAGDTIRANDSVTVNGANIGSAVSKNIPAIGSIVMSAFPTGK